MRPANINNHGFYNYNQGWSAPVKRKKTAAEIARQEDIRLAVEMELEEKRLKAELMEEWEK